MPESVDNRPATDVFLVNKVIIIVVGLIEKNDVTLVDCINFFANRVDVVVSYNCSMGKQYTDSFRSFQYLKSMIRMNNRKDAM